MSDFLPPDKRMCHLTGFTKSCKKLVQSGKCERWVNVQGLHPQTGEIINRYNCIDDWQYLLLIENSKLQRETGAAVESFRNEMVVANERAAVLMSNDLRERMLAQIRTNGNAPALTHDHFTSGRDCVYEARERDGNTSAWCQIHGWECPHYERGT